ncbi:hypothetical protein HNP84_002023 [Thermocatellispora tengchongensis]|uniref:Uncharacterized protein n=1 Tax=Thermocatellispora tengchongensis TaxID=1073253 RepID=A0A840P508_9ACTN|nr:hypothetical protein [Thermocatellispora tengchongensis]MBB5132307.1 hypothetical protein [Thermocatellispora tengchongensis]
MIGLSLGHRTEREAEHWLREIVPPSGLPGLVACTHLVQAPYPHVAISLAVAEPPPGLPAPAPELRDAAGRAAAEHAARRSGRAVLYPGVERLTGTLTVGEVLAVSAIERVTQLGGPPPGPDVEVETRDFVRPLWHDGLLTLVTVPVAGGRVAPFEVPDPTPCCADH